MAPTGAMEAMAGQGRRSGSGSAPTDPPRLRVCVVGEDQAPLFLIDPQGGSLLVESPAQEIHVEPVGTLWWGGPGAG